MPEIPEAIRREVAQRLDERRAMREALGRPSEAHREWSEQLGGRSLAAVSGLLHEAGETHHYVYRIVDGADDDWASWYAQWLITAVAAAAGPGGDAGPKRAGVHAGPPRQGVRRTGSR
jgi:hypothetical protein